jgi:hypothetical protein
VQAHQPIFDSQYKEQIQELDCRWREGLKRTFEQRHRLLIPSDLLLPNGDLMFKLLLLVEEIAKLAGLLSKVEVDFGELLSPLTDVVCARLLGGDGLVEFRDLGFDLHLGRGNAFRTAKIRMG